jgi:hypothetical protein
MLHIVDKPGLQILPTCLASLTALADELALCGCELSVVWWVRRPAQGLDFDERCAHAPIPRRNTAVQLP